MCNRNIAGACPPSDTVLKDEMRGGDAPFAGYTPPPEGYVWGLSRKVIFS